MDEDALLPFAVEMRRNAVLSEEYKQHLIRMVRAAVDEAHHKGVRQGRAEVYRKWGGKGQQPKLPSEAEWSGTTEGQGFGPMHNPGRGPLFPSCPECKGLKPGTGAETHFNASAIGHKPGCPFRGGCHE